MISGGVKVFLDWGANPKEGPSTYFGHFLQKLHKIEQNWIKRDGDVRS